MLESKENNTEEKKVTSARRTRRPYTPRKKQTRENDVKNEDVKKERAHRVSKKIKENNNEIKPEYRAQNNQENKIDKTPSNAFISNVQTNSLLIQNENNSPKVTRKENQNSIFKKSKLKIIPLGGLHEVGKNITVFAYEDEMIVVDCGLSFPDDDMLGVDIVIPDIAYIVRNQEKLKGMVITHGHEDHIGSVPYFLKQVNTPIYGTKLTLGLIKNKLDEHNLVESTKFGPEGE